MSHLLIAEDESRIASFLEKGLRDHLCDVDLAFSDGRRRITGPDDLVVIESKTAGAAAPADVVLWRLGHRPVSMSKYCVGLALLHPDLPANRWNRVLRGQFGWSPDRGGRLLQHAA